MPTWRRGPSSRSPVRTAFWRSRSGMAVRRDAWGSDEERRCCFALMREAAPAFPRASVGLTLQADASGLRVRDLPVVVDRAQRGRAVYAEVVERAARRLRAACARSPTGPVFARANQDFAARLLQHHAAGYVDMDGAEGGGQIDRHVAGPLAAEIEIDVTGASFHVDHSGVRVAEADR